MHYVYVLWSERLEKRYVGSTGNLEERLRQHNRGLGKYTRGGIPWRLVYEESKETVEEARKRELFLKTGVGRKWLDKIVGEV